MKHIQYEPNNKPLARALRRAMTKQERHLWYDFLKQLPVSVNRQKPFGNYIVDFYIASANLVIELDGSQHYEEENKRQDSQRDAYLVGLGLKVKRYSNYEIDRQFDSVCRDIAREVGVKVE
jgi:very-short-patch-repair endonuclease